LSRTQTPPAARRQTINVDQIYIVVYILAAEDTLEQMATNPFKNDGPPINP